MDFWTTAWANRDMLMMGPLIGAMCSLLSVYIVLRRMSLISEGVSHAGFGGIGAAILLGYFFPAIDLPQYGSNGTLVSGSNIWWQLVTGLFCLGTALLIGYVTTRKRVSEDAAIGIFLVAAVALGDILIKSRLLLQPEKAMVLPDVEALLFGDFNSVNRSDVYLAGGVALIVFACVGIFYHQFLYTALDAEMARVNGVNTRLINLLQLLLVSMVIVVCGRRVGFLIITALTIIPGATANMLSRKFSGVLIGSLIIGTLGTFAATCLAMVRPFANYPAGALVVLVLFAFFAVVWTFRHFVKPRPAEEDATFSPVQAAPPGAFGHRHTH